MPAPDHLIPLLTALGNGGTVATATAVAAAAGGLPGQVPAPPFEALLSALGDGGTRDVADRIVNLYKFAGPLAKVIAATSPETVTATVIEAPDHVIDGDDSEAFSDDDWEPSGMDEFVADPKPTPRTDLMPEAASAATVRAWAKANGVTCPARGAIPAAVRDQYDAAQADA